MKERALRDLSAIVILYSAAFAIPDLAFNSPADAACATAWVLPLLTLAFLVAASRGGMAMMCGLSCSRCGVSRIVRTSAPFSVFLLVPMANLGVAWGGPWGFSVPSFVILICAAVVEELCFRGYLLGIFLTGGWRPLPAVFAVSLAFAGLHLFNIGSLGATYVGVQLIVAGCLGFAFGIVRLCTTSIYPCIVLHIVVNVTSGKMLLYDSGNLWLVCAAAIVAAVWSCLWWNWHRKG